MSNEVENLKLRAGKSKAPLGIVPLRMLYGMARVLEDSACKYAPYNYMAQPLKDALESYDSALLRHRIACTLIGGQVTPESYAELDEDSGLPHIFHLLTGLTILATLMIRDGNLPLDPGPGRRKRKQDAIEQVTADLEAGRLFVPRSDSRHLVDSLVYAMNAMQSDTEHRCEGCGSLLAGYQRTPDGRLFCSICITAVEPAPALPPTPDSKCDIDCGCRDLVFTKTEELEEADPTREWAREARNSWPCNGGAKGMRF